VIVGAGFGGLWAAKQLGGEAVEALLLDRNNYHTFFPLLYQVAAAELDPGDIAYPVRTILRKYDNVNFRLAEVWEIDVKKRRLSTDVGQIGYDYLILSLGSAVHYFDVPGAQEHAFALRTMDQAIALRNHILTCFERAEFEADEQKRRSLLTFVIVGGGPTGVEYAGALAELIKRPLARDFPGLDLGEVRVILVEALDGLLVGLPDPLRRYARKRLEKMGVEVHLETFVSAAAKGKVTIKGKEPIAAETVVWTAGVRGAPEAGTWKLPLTAAGRVAVEQTLQVSGLPDVYVIGDLALVEGQEALPMVAQNALQQGKHAARNVLRQVQGKEQKPFDYFNYGTMAVIGRNSAVAHLFSRWSFTGFTAWVIWLGIHFVWLIGFRNRLAVLLNWAWDYLFLERVIRLILR
jgi:NADH dehydrogenase